MGVCFYVEKTLGRLVKWLRLMGFDTLFEQDISIEQYPDLNERVRVTRTRCVFDHYGTGRCILIRSNHWFEQLSQIVDTLGIDRDAIRPYSRCLQCNTRIKHIDKAQVDGKVPDYVRDIHHTFKVCDRCAKIYWPGSHLRRSMETLNRLFTIEDRTGGCPIKNRDH